MHVIYNWKRRKSGVQVVSVWEVHFPAKNKREKDESDGIMNSKKKPSIQTIECSDRGGQLWIEKTNVSSHCSAVQDACDLWLKKEKKTIKGEKVVSGQSKCSFV
jgi:hypothetical protein